MAQIQARLPRSEQTERRARRPAAVSAGAAESDHVHPSLWRRDGDPRRAGDRRPRRPLAGLRCAADRAAASRTRGGALARRYLQVHGPRRLASFPAPGDAGSPHAKQLWGAARAEQLAPSATPGARRGRGARAPEPKGARLIYPTWTRWRARKEPRGAACLTRPCASGCWSVTGGPRHGARRRRGVASAPAQRRASGSTSTSSRAHAQAGAEREALAAEAGQPRPVSRQRRRRASPPGRNSGSASISTTSIWAFCSLPA